MSKVKFFLLVAVVYLAGFVTGVCMQNVKAIVQAPGENNNLNASSTAYSPPAPQNTNEMNALQQQGQQLQQQMIDRPLSPPAAADDRGATLYSISTSMRVDIERLEDDIAVLKNKVNILNNMR